MQSNYGLIRTEGCHESGITLWQYLGGRNVSNINHANSKQP
jgi:hypothetical protein